MRIRVFTTKDENGNDLVLEFRPPSQGSLNAAELIFKKTFSKCFRDGILTSVEVEKILRERGIWDDDKEREAAVLQLQIGNLEAKLKDGEEELGDEAAKAICEELVVLRTELQNHNDPIVSIAENTCESVGGEERNQFLVTQCIYHKTTGSRVYKSVEDFKSRAEEQAARDSYMETVIASLEVTMGEELPSDLSQIYSENRWLTAYSERVAEEERVKIEAEEAAKEAEAEAEVEAEADEPEPEAKPKKAKKRKKKAASKD